MGVTLTGFSLDEAGHLKKRQMSVESGGYKRLGSPFETNR